MCGIAGYMSINDKRPDPKKMVKMFDLLETRGTDASGIAYPQNGKMEIYKDGIRASALIKRRKFKKVMRSLPSTMIFHCRASTHGSEKENRNNHPIHTGGNVALVHNGVIRNHDEIGKKPDGVEVDTMAIMHLIDTYPNVSRFGEALGKLSGSMACAVLRVEKNDNKLWLFRESNPIVFIQDTKTDIIYFASSDHILDCIKATGDMFDMPHKVMIELSQKQGIITDLSGFQMKSGYSVCTSSCSSMSTSSPARASHVSVHWNPPEDEKMPIGTMKYNVRGLWEKLGKNVWHYTPYSDDYRGGFVWVDGKPYEANALPTTEKVSDVEFTVLGDEEEDTSTVEMSEDMLEAYYEGVEMRSKAFQVLTATDELYSPPPEIRVPTYGLEGMCRYCNVMRNVYRTLDGIFPQKDCFKCTVCNMIIPEEEIECTTPTVSKNAF